MKLIINRDLKDAREGAWNRIGSIIGSRLRIQFSAAPPFTATSRLFAYNDRLHWHFDDQLWVKRSTSLSSNTRAFMLCVRVRVRVCVEHRATSVPERYTSIERRITHFEFTD